MIEVEKDANLNQLATMLGSTIANLPDKFDEIIADYQKGFDKMLMLQGMKASPQSITMPDPKEFMNNALMSYAASLSIPLKILVGSQTGMSAHRPRMPKSGTKHAIAAALISFAQTSCALSSV